MKKVVIFSPLVLLHENFKYSQFKRLNSIFHLVHPDLFGVVCDCQRCCRWQYYQQTWSGHSHASHLYKQGTGFASCWIREVRGLKVDNVHPLQPTERGPIRGWEATCRAPSFKLVSMAQMVHQTCFVVCHKPFMLCSLETISTVAADSVTSGGL